MGGIDEAALDRLALVTEMTKHVRIRASGGRPTTSELGQFSPVFVWLLRVSILSNLRILCMQLKLTFWYICFILSFKLR